MKSPKFPSPASFADRRNEILDYVEGDIRRAPEQVRAMLVDLLAELAKGEARLLGLQQELAQQEVQLLELVKQVQATRWIPVAEQLPAIPKEVGHSYAVQVIRGGHVSVYAAFLTAAGWHELGAPGLICGVTAWRHFEDAPLPAVLPDFQQEGGNAA